MRRLGLVLVLGMLAGPLSALDCRGPMTVANEDGTSVTYDLTLSTQAGKARLEAVARDSGEVTEDAADCQDNDTHCRVEFVDDAGKVEDFYDFWLEAGDGGLYRYSERWADGSTTEATLECR